MNNKEYSVACASIMIESIIEMLKFIGGENTRFDRVFSVDEKDTHALHPYIKAADEFIRNTINNIESPNEFEQELIESYIILCFGNTHLGKGNASIMSESYAIDLLVNKLKLSSLLKAKPLLSEARNLCYEIFDICAEELWANQKDDLADAIAKEIYCPK